MAGYKREIRIANPYFMLFYFLEVDYEQNGKYAHKQTCH